MSEQKPNRSGRELLNALNHLFSEVDPETPEENEAAIKAVGYDPGSFARRMQSIAKQAMQDSPLNWRNKARAELEEGRKRLEVNSVSPAGGRESLLSRIQTLLAQIPGKSSLAYAHHRNLDKASEEDLLSLVEELEHLIGHVDPSTDGN